MPGEDPGFYQGKVAVAQPEFVEVGLDIRK